MPGGAILVVLMRNLAVRNTYTIIVYVQGGKLEGGEISEKSCEKEGESVQAVKKDGVPRGAIPAVLMRNLAVGNTYTMIIYVQAGKFTYDFSSCSFPKFKKSTKRGSSREMTSFFISTSPK